MIGRPRWDSSLSSVWVRCREPVTFGDRAGRTDTEPDGPVVLTVDRTEHLAVAVRGQSLQWLIAPTEEFLAPSHPRHVRRA